MLVDSEAAVTPPGLVGTTRKALEEPGPHISEGGATDVIGREISCRYPLFSPFTIETLPLFLRLVPFRRPPHSGDGLRVLATPAGGVGLIVLEIASTAEPLPLGSSDQRAHLA